MIRPLLVWGLGHLLVDSRYVNYRSQVKTFLTERQVNVVDALTHNHDLRPGTLIDDFSNPGVEKIVNERAVRAYQRLRQIAREPIDLQPTI